MILIFHAELLEQKDHYVYVLDSELLSGSITIPKSIATVCSRMRIYCRMRSGENVKSRFHVMYNNVLHEARVDHSLRFSKTVLVRFLHSQSSSKLTDR